MIEILEIKVGLFAGSSDINISDVIVEVGSRANQASFTFLDTDQASEYNETASATQFTVRPVRDTYPFNESLTYAMMTPGDAAIFFIDANATGLGLYTHTEFTIKIIPKHGVSTEASYTTPSVYLRRCINIS